MPDGRSLFRRKQRRTPHRYAAHQVAVPARAETIRQLSAKLDTWQRRVLNYAELIPEVMTGYSFVHNTLDMVTFEIQRFDRHNNEWVADESPEMQGIERRINNTFKAGRAAALGHLVEEAYILVTRNPDNSFQFETLAPTEITSKGNTSERRVQIDGAKDTWVPISGDVRIIRVYTPDPADRNKASGAHKPLLSLLETMALELSRDQAEAISILAGNGILYIPTEILPDEVDTLDASTTPGSRKGFEDLLEESMLGTINDRAKGEAVVPVLLYGPGEEGANIRHILPTRSSTASEATDRMNGYIERYARSIDLPAQVILGLGDANHWSDWKVDENTWAYHLRPRAQRIADALYTGLVSGIVTNLGHDTAEYRLVPDAGKAIAKTDMSKTAIDVYKVGAITPEALIEATGFDPSDMREDAEELQVCAINCSDTGAAGSALSPTSPDRTAAASSNPRVIMRQASRVANQHQRKLEAIFRGVLAQVATAAARDGKKAKTLKALSPIERTAADPGDVPFLDYHPGTYLARYSAELQTATNDELFAYLRRIATLTGLDYRHLRSIWKNELEARAAAVAIQAEAAAESVARRSFLSGKPMRIADNVVRTMTSTANGGVNAGNGAAGNTNHPTHAGQDPAMKDALTESVGAYATKYTWIVGDPQRPFEPHQDLDGREWYSWEEFDALDVDDADSWLPGSVYFPGDHDGCQCDYDIEFVPVPAGESDQEAA